MRRRTTFLALASAAALAVLVTTEYARRALRTHDPLAGIDVEAARGAARDEAAFGGPSGEGAAVDEVSHALPSRAALEALADEAALREHIAALESALGVGSVDETARGELHVLLSTAYRLVGDHEAARRHADAAVARLPGSSRAHQTRARALAARLIDAGRERGWAKVLGSLGDIGEYKGELAAAIELDPENLDARDEEVAVFLFAPWPIGDAKRARARIDALEALDPLRGALWRAQALAKDDEDAEALGSLDTYLATRTAPLDAAELARVALVRGQLLQSQDRFADAAAAYEPLLAGRADAAHFQATYEAAKVRQRGGFELERAIALLDDFLAAAPVGDFIPPTTGAWYRRGLCLRDLGRVTEARDSLRRALELDAKNERARDALAELGE